MKNSWNFKKDDAGGDISKGFAILKNKNMYSPVQGQIFLNPMTSFKKRLLLIFALILSGCNEQHELAIQEADENCSCAEEIRRVQRLKIKELQNNLPSYPNYGEGIQFREGIRYGDVKCDRPFYKEGQNSEQYSTTKTLEIFNKSETKVYEVLIQFKNSGKVSYESFHIEPTQSIILGCNFKFDASLDKVGGFEKSVDINKMELTNFRPIEYNIHKVDLLAEY